MKLWILAVALIVIAIAPVLMIVYHDMVEPNIRPSILLKSQNFKAGDKREIKACKVLDGYRFEICLDNGEWIEGHLRVAAKDEAIGFVTRCLNRATPPSPSVTLIRQVGRHWIVDIELTLDGKRENMIDLLKASGLLL